jgi:hypothetical protein
MAGKKKNVQSHGGEHMNSQTAEMLSEKQAAYQNRSNNISLCQIKGKKRDMCIPTVPPAKVLLKEKE